MPLVIVESPAKCGKIKGFLGLGYDVIASMGHIRALVEDLDSVGINRDFEPQFEFQKEKLKTINAIKEAAKTHKEIILASDDDREGEAIAYSLCVLLKLDPLKAKRAVFHEITKDAVTKAVASPRLLDMNKVHAQQSRSILDMLVGFTISPLLWNHVGHSLSAGRCQTPALRLVDEKEQEIAKFTSSCSWKVEGSWSYKNKTINAFLTDELEDKDSASTYLEMRISKYKGKVISAVTTPFEYQPPKPLITSTLQQQASSLLRINPKNTMKIAQRLYEAGHITYMRTDQAVLSEEAVLEASDLIVKNYGQDYLGSKKKKGKKVQETEVKAQEAHEAIRPTHFSLESLSVSEDWSAVDRKLYKIIWTRAMQSLMSPAKGEKRRIEFRAEGDDEDWTWRSVWSRTTFDGWRKLNWKEIEDEIDEEAADEEWLFASGIKTGHIFEWTSLKAEPHFTKASARYTEASLIKDLEEKGIGRPSTFAMLVSTIMDKGYVEKKDFEGGMRTVDWLLLEKGNKEPTVNTKEIKQGGEKDRMVPTVLGQSVLKYLLANFQNLFAYEFTAKMEKRLDEIALGNEPWKQVLRDTWSSYKDKYQEQIAIKKSKSDFDSERRRELGENLVVVTTKKGCLLLKESPDKDKEKTVFYGWPTGVGFSDLTLEKAREFILANEKGKLGDTIGEIDGSPVIKKKGPYGWYAECNGKKVACQEDATIEKLTEQFQNQESATLKVIGQFQIRKGPYGPYMFKTEAAKKEFVSIPPNMNIEELNEAACIAIFQHGLQQKARSKQIGSGSQRGRGGGRGRGGFRGRGS